MLYIPQDVPKVPKLHRPAAPQQPCYLKGGLRIAFDSSQVSSQVSRRMEDCRIMAVLLFGSLNRNMKKDDFLQRKLVTANVSYMEEAASRENVNNGFRDHFGEDLYLSSPPMKAH